MEVIILGSGTGIISLQRGAPGHCLQIAGRHYLIDCGSGTLRQLLRAGLRHDDLDGAFITHVHADHIGDLIPLVHAMRLPGSARSKPFTLFGPPGFLEFFGRIVAPVVAPPGGFLFSVTEVPAAWPLCDGVMVRSFATPHVSRFASRAYRFEYRGGSVCFSGDTDWDPGLVTFLQNADLALLECSTLDAQKVEGHLSAGLCGRIAASAQVRHLVLNHFYPIDGPDSLFVEQCRLHYAGALDLAADGMTFVVESEAS